MQDALSSVLCAMAQSYETAEPLPETRRVIKVSQPKASKGSHSEGIPSKLSKTAAIQAVIDPILNGGNAPSMIPAVVLPAKGSLDAKGFVLALRNAKTRDERIQAIAGYVGFDSKKDFGSQELMASLQAKREMSPLKVSPSQDFSRRTSQATVSAEGFVAGMPDTTQAQVQNLLARERLATDTLIAEQKKEDDTSLSSEERTIARVKAGVERERLAAIRNDLRLLGV